MCWVLIPSRGSIHVALLAFMFSDTAVSQPQSCFCRFKFLQTSSLYTANTLRDSQSIPDGDSLWKRPKRRQLCGFPARLLSWIKQSNRQT